MTFKNVPLNVPDEELINLCMCYGRPVDNKVTYEILTNTRNRGHTGSTRSVDMEFDNGAITITTIGWKALSPGTRVLVLHNNQVPQCSFCKDVLLRAMESCVLK